MSLAKLTVNVAALVLVLIASQACRGSSPHVIEPLVRGCWLFVSSTGSNSNLDSGVPAPVEISFVGGVARGDEDRGRTSFLDIVEFDAGEGDGWLDVTLQGSTALEYTVQLSHTYEDQGSFKPRLRATYWDGEVITATGRDVVVTEPAGGESSGEGGFDEEDEWVIREFTDPRDGTTYEIIDGRALVAFFLPVDMDSAWQFVADEQLDVLSEWWMIGAISVLLPAETSVEEAVGEWPEEYPDLIESVDPDAVVAVD